MSTMLRALLRHLLDRLGARYPRVMLAALFQLAFLVVLAGVWLLDLYVRLSSVQFWRILGVTEAAVAIEIAAALAVAFRLVRPADAWLRGERTPVSAIAAWRALAGLPLDLIRYGRGLPIVFNVVPIAVYLALEIGGPFVPAVLVLAAGVGVLVALGVAFTISFELSLLLLRSIVGPIQDLQTGTARVAAGDFTARVPVVGSDETGRLAGSFNQMVAGLEERARLREAFGAFVDPAVADRVAEGTALEGEDVEVTVLFIDIRGFTAFAERSTAREVVAELNRFYDYVVPLLAHHGGHANKFVGDGLLAVFGAPDRVADHADRAIEAALQVIEVVAEAYEGGLTIGIGVNSGTAVSGTVGGGGRLEFTVIGDTVNTAARVEEATRDTGDLVLVTEATCALLRRDHGGFQERRDVPLKGKTERIRLYAPNAVAAERAPDGREVGEVRAVRDAREMDDAAAAARRSH